ncbi:hypothetical protein [uncultured Cetobacterium sp.]|uniref:hypothetical protein n=1 Tax=uncultured Cetobacterium sp. TaxID=527638 RepID=UPI002621D551|nr:hypothetical protein [uncultured Cetobacterium sp.]
MYINSKHLQILKVIQNNQVSNLKDISDIFLLSQQHTKIHLEDIYCELFLEPSGDLKIEDAIEKIKTFPNARNILKNLQQFTKNQKIFYLIFRLIKDRHIKLSHVCEDLDLTKRNLNNYLNEVSSILLPYKLKIKVSNKGLVLNGTSYSLKRFTYLLVFKFLIEKDFLPTQVRNELVNFIKINNFHEVRKDIIKFIQIVNCNFIDYTEISFFCFYLFFKAKPKEKKISDISSKEILKYKPSYYDNEFFYKIFDFLKNSSFKDTSAINLHDLFNIIDIFKYSRNRFEKHIYYKANDIRDIFAKYMGPHIYENPNFFNTVIPWINYSYIKSLFYIDDSKFLNLNLNYFSNSNIYEMTKEINYILPRFTLYESIFIWYSFSKPIFKELNNIFVFKNLPVTIIPTLIEEIYKKHNIKISDYVHLRSFSEYSKKNTIHNIVLVENFSIHNTDIPIKNLYFPIPNYKRITPT